jgi:hypothetical protein
MYSEEEHISSYDHCIGTILNFNLCYTQCVRHQSQVKLPKRQVIDMYSAQPQAKQSTSLYLQSTLSQIPSPLNTLGLLAIRAKSLHALSCPLARESVFQHGCK